MQASPTSHSRSHIHLGSPTTIRCITIALACMAVCSALLSVSVFSSGSWYSNPSLELTMLGNFGVLPTNLGQNYVTSNVTLSSDSNFNNSLCPNIASQTTYIPIPTYAQSSITRAHQEMGVATLFFCSAVSDQC